MLMVPVLPESGFWEEPRIATANFFNRLNVSTRQPARSSG